MDVHGGDLGGEDGAEGYEAAGCEGEGAEVGGYVAGGGEG